MTRKEIKDKIRAIEKERRELHDKVSASKDVEEVRNCNNRLSELLDQRDELDAMLDDLEERSIPEGAQLVNGNIIRSAYGLGSGQVRSFSYGSGSANAANKGIDSLALRSNESLASRVPETSRKSLDLGKYVRGAVTGKWDNALEERSAFTTTSTGVIIPEILSAHVIDKARNQSLFTSAGVPVVPMSTNNLTIGRVASDPVFGFKEELAAAEENTFSLDAVQLNAKTAYGYAYCSLEAIHSAENLTDILYQVFSQAMADMCDRGMLYGQLSNGSAVSYAPAGIMNDEDINAVVATNNFYDDFIRAIGAVRRNNGNPTVVGMNAATEEYLALLADANGRMVEEPKVFADLRKVVSNQLAEDDETGSDALVFDPNAMIIGVQNNLVFRMFQDTDYCIEHGAVGFQIYSMLDCAAVQPKHIAKITGIGVQGE